MQGLLSKPGDITISNKNQGFNQYGAVFKLKYSDHYLKRADTHYMNVINAAKSNFLHDYAPFDLSVYEGMPITDGDVGVATYYVENGKKRLFPNYDTLSAMNFTYADIITIYNNSDFQSIELGTMLPKLDF